MSDTPRTYEAGGRRWTVTADADGWFSVRTETDTVISRFPTRAEADRRALHHAIYEPLRDAPR